MEDCIFCKIIDKKIPAKLILETETLIAFEDIAKVAPLHILIIPKEHILNLYTIGETKPDFINDIFASINKIAKKENLDKSGFRVVVNSGEDAGQTVSHLHFHLLAKRKMTWPPG